MKQLQSNISRNWHYYAAIILPIILTIAEDYEWLSPKALHAVEMILITSGLMVSRGKPKITLTRRSSTRLLPFLLLFFLIQCKPKPVDVRDQAKAQVKDKLTRTYEKAIAAVDSMPAPVVDGLLTNDDETRRLFEHFFELERKQ